MEDRRGPNSVLGAPPPWLRGVAIIDVSAPAEERTIGTTQHSRQARDTVAPGQLSQRVFLGVPPPPPPLPPLRAAAPCPCRVIVARVGPWSLFLGVVVVLPFVVEQFVHLLAQHQLLDELFPPLVGELLSDLNCLV